MLMIAENDKLSHITRELAFEHIGASINLKYMAAKETQARLEARSSASTVNKSQALATPPLVGRSIDKPRPQFANVESHHM